MIKDGKLTLDEISSKVGANPKKLYRIMRYLTSEGVFKLEGDKFSLTAAGQYLRSDMEGSMRWCMIHW